MFFEPLSVEREQGGRGRPEASPWEVPPALELGSIVAVDRIVARSANVVIVVPAIRAFETGCLFSVEVVGRQDALSVDEWWDLGMSAHPVHPVRAGADRLPDRLLRFGVRYASGAKATTVGFSGQATDPPAGPVLSWQPSGGGGGSRGGSLYMFHHMGLWLWPLPPAEPIEFAVEWPFAGIDLTLAELDGAAIVSAARRSVRYWPDSVDDRR